jgi:hypothetical protein
MITCWNSPFGRKSAPIDGHDWAMRAMAHGYTNNTRGDGEAVVKRYEGAGWQRRRDTEAAALTELAGRLPVPRVISVEAGALTMTHLPGVHGQDLIAAGHAVPVLRSCGEMLRRLQSVEPRLVHGDYGPNNMLFDPSTFEVTAVLDWEWAARGEPVTDLAWCEWIVRTHHEGEVGALGALFDGYGHRPPLADRRAAAAWRCEELRDAFTSHHDVWQRRLDATLAWTGH